MEPRQGDWRQWTAHDAYRLSQAHAALAAGLPRATAARHPCAAPAPLTATPER
jgi:hypothetical protein